MTKRIYLLRHAQAAADAGFNDHERRLTPKGEADALRLGEWMRAQNYLPELALVSSAVRTQSTAELVRLGGNMTPKVAIEPALYNAAPEDMFSALGNISNTVGSVMMVAHNPGIHLLAMRLCEDDTSPLVHKLMQNYEPCTLSVIDCEIDNWAALQHGNNQLIRLEHP